MTGACACLVVPDVRSAEVAARHLLALGQLEAVLIRIGAGLVSDEKPKTGYFLKVTLTIPSVP